MKTVFSHIIQKRFSQVNEDVATDALAYVLQSSQAAQRGLTKLLRGIVPDLPSLRFKTQQAEGAIRPDMWGFDDHGPRVYVENKFWAGLTDSQPVSYLKRLAAYAQPTVLLVVAPAAREHALWRELSRRLADAGISGSECDSPAGVSGMVRTELGPIIALTSWTNVLSVMEHEAVDDPAARSDLVQLRSLCDASDNEAFTPLSRQELSDQRTPALVLQLSSIVQTAVDLAVTENILSVTATRPRANWHLIGRWALIAGNRGAGAWIGTHFVLWKQHGTTPLWLVFYESEWGRAQDVAHLVEPWAAARGILTATSSREFAIGLDVPPGEERAGVVRSLVDQLKAIATVLAALPPRTSEVVDVMEEE